MKSSALLLCSPASPHLFILQKSDSRILFLSFPQNSQPQPNPVTIQNLSPVTSPRFPLQFSSSLPALLLHSRNISIWLSWLLHHCLGKLCENTFIYFLINPPISSNDCKSYSPPNPPCLLPPVTSETSKLLLVPKGRPQRRENSVI